MASITIRNLDDQTKARLRIRAARNGRSMEEEARTVLRTVLIDSQSPEVHVADAIRRRFQRLGGVLIRLPDRQPMREPPKPGR
jgi:plasmid stability protein